MDLVPTSEEQDRQVNIQMAEAMKRAREGILAALKSTSKVLRGMQDEHDNKMHYLLRPKAPSIIKLK